jgi:transposase
MGRKNRQYTLEFKQQAVDLANRIGFSKAGSQLGVETNNIRRWAKELSAIGQAEAKKTKTSLEEENRRLQRENDELKKVNHILKRAAAFFSQDHLK